VDYRSQLLSRSAHYPQSYLPYTSLKDKYVIDFSCLDPEKLSVDESKALQHWLEGGRMYHDVQLLIAAARRKDAWLA
jgi:hypothetical protein